MKIEFSRNNEQEKGFKELLSRFDEAERLMKPSAGQTALTDLEHLRDAFRRRVETFRRVDRKLSIAVVGRVKAGKSSFLNSLLFDGKDVLPRAFTPKTATLTKIEYAPENAIEVEYYTKEEWTSLCGLSQQSRTGDDVLAAKDLVGSARKSGIDVGSYLAKGHERVEFPSEQDLMGRLNDYVGESGKVTPLVKCVTLYTNRSELDGVSIVDTPGLCDPVASRTVRTREFLEVCDTVFFLSPASTFLTSSDVDLLRMQLPQKGITHLSLVCSRFDEGLADAIFDYDSLEDAVSDTRSRLQKQALKTFTPKSGDNPDANQKKLLEACQHPHFLSSMFHNMAGRAADTYTAHEKHAFDQLNEHGDLDARMVASIGDISGIEKDLRQVIDEKDTLLAERAAGMLPTARGELRTFISNEQQGVEAHLMALTKNDQQKLEQQRKDAERRIMELQARIEEHFGGLNVKIEQIKGSILSDLRRSSTEYGKLTDRTRTETRESSHEVSDSCWYKPWTWFSSHTEYTTYQVEITYLLASDALENIRNYARSAAESIEQGFAGAVNIPQLKTDLLKMIIDGFDVSSETYDPAHFRLLTEQTLNRIELPVMRISAEAAVAGISSSFSGEIQSASERSEMRSRLSKAVADLYDSISAQLVQEISSFKQKVNDLKDDFAKKLLKDIQNDYDRLIKECRYKEESIRRLQSYDNALSGFLKSLPA